MELSTLKKLQKEKSNIFALPQNCITMDIIYKSTLFILLIIGSRESYAQKSINQIINKLKQTERYEGFEIPGYVIRMTSRIAKWGDKDQQSEDFIKLIKKVKSITVSSTTLDQKKFNNAAIVNSLASKIKEEDSFEEYMAVQNKRENLKVLINDKKDKINNVVIVSSSGRELSFIHLKTALSFDDLKNIDFKSIEKEVKKVKVKTDIED
jgi:Domain of unknown function (DUF4252)